MSITGQIDQGIRQIQARHRVDHFVAYFQSATNTYATLERLRDVFEEAITCPKVIGLAVGTRPDCAGEGVLDLLDELAGRTWVSIEFGLQSIHRRSLDWMNRRHDHATFIDAVQRSRFRHLEVGAHIILGLPGESRDDMLATARELARLQIDAVKLHNLHAVRNTPLARMVTVGQIRLPLFDEYVGWVVDFLEELPPNCVVDRLSADAPPEYLVGPSWCRNKSAVREAIDAEFRRRGTCQSHKAATASHVR